MDEYQKCKICKSDIITVNKKFNLVQCVRCNLIFCKKKFSQIQFTILYDELYNKENPKYKNYSVTEYNMLLQNKKIKIGYYRAKLLKKHVLNGYCNSVLEIGSGIGLMGSYIRSKNKKINYLGVEIDKVSYEKSQSLGLNTLNGDFTIIQDVSETFDVIMLWEVIEHLQDLNLFVRLAHEKLNKNGKIILSTPNFNKIYNYPNRKTDSLYQDAPPIHLNFFTNSSIASIFKLNGFEVCDVKIKKYPYLEIRKVRFYVNCIKAVFKKYNGSTIFFSAIKKQTKQN